MTNLDKAIRRHKNAKEFWAIACIERDNRRCKHCNSDELSCSLVVHHLDKSRINGYKSMNNDLNNLILLCRSCHAKIHEFFKERLDVLEKRATGMSLGDVGKMYGVSRQRIYQIIRKHDNWQEIEAKNWNSSHNKDVLDKR